MPDMHVSWHACNTEANLLHLAKITSATIQSNFSEELSYRMTQASPRASATGYKC